MLDETFILYNLIYAARLLIALLVLIIIFYKKKYVRYLLFVLIGIVIFFFRNNLDDIDKDRRSIVSPSSSKVEKIKELQDKVYYLTYLSQLDRHFMIAPVDCRIIEISKALKKGDAERVKVVCVDNYGKEFELHLIVKKPMAGIGVFGGWVPKLFYKNRIVMHSKVGDEISKGERLGLIRFGSNMEYIFPKSYYMSLELGDHYNVGDIIGKI